MGRLIEYLAGFFDGEGSISLREIRNKVRIRIGQVEKQPLQIYASVFGGAVRYSQITKGGLPYYQYDTNDSKRCGSILSNLYPYLLVKQAKAQAALERLGLPVPTSIEEVSDEYLAGFFDAEGSISVANFTSINVCVTQKDKAPLLLFQQRFGGCIYHKGNSVYGWALRSKELQEFCNTLIPYVVVQKKRLALLKKFQSIDLRRKMDNCLREDLRKEKFKIAIQIEVLNDRESLRVF